MNQIGNLPEPYEFSRSTLELCVFNFYNWIELEVTDPGTRKLLEGLLQPLGRTANFERFDAYLAELEAVSPLSQEWEAVRTERANHDNVFLCGCSATYWHEQGHIDASDWIDEVIEEARLDDPEIYPYATVITDTEGDYVTAFVETPSFEILLTYVTRGDREDLADWREITMEKIPNEPRIAIHLTASPSTLRSVPESELVRATIIYEIVTMNVVGLADQLPIAFDSDDLLDVDDALYSAWQLAKDPDLFLAGRLAILPGATPPTAMKLTAEQEVTWIPEVNQAVAYQLQQFKALPAHVQDIVRTLSPNWVGFASDLYAAAQAVTN